MKRIPLLLTVLIIIAFFSSTPILLSVAGGSYIQNAVITLGYPIFIGYFAASFVFIAILIVIGIPSISFLAYLYYKYEAILAPFPKNYLDSDVY
jgi:hypothetical protein